MQEHVFVNHFTKFIGYAPLEDKYISVTNDIPVIPFQYIILDANIEHGQIVPILLIFTPNKNKTKLIQYIFNNYLLNSNDNIIKKITDSYREFQKNIRKISASIQSSSILSKSLSVNMVLRAMLEYSGDAFFEVNGTHRIYPQFVAYSPWKTIEIWAKCLSIASIDIEKHVGNIIHVQVDGLDAALQSPYMKPLVAQPLSSSMELNPPATFVPQTGAELAAKAAAAKAAKSARGAKGAKGPSAASIGGSQVTCSKPEIIMWKYDGYKAMYPPMRDALSFIEEYQSRDANIIDLFLYLKKSTQKNIKVIWLSAPIRNQKDNYDDPNTEYYFNLDIPVDSNKIYISETLKFLEKIIVKKNCFLLYNFILHIFTVKDTNVDIISFILKHIKKVFTGVWVTVNRRSVLVSDFWISNDYMYTNSPDDTALSRLNGSLVPLIALHSNQFDRIPHEVLKNIDEYMSNYYNIESFEFLHVKPLYCMHRYEKNIILSGNISNFYHIPSIAAANNAFNKGYKASGKVHILNTYTNKYHEQWVSLAKNYKGDYLVDGPWDSIAVKSDCTLKRFATNNWNNATDKEHKMILLAVPPPGENRELNFK